MRGEVLVVIKPCGDGARSGYWGFRTPVVIRPQYLPSGVGILAQRKPTNVTKLVQRMVKNRHVTGLMAMLTEEDAPAATARLALEGLIEIGSAEAWDGICEVVSKSGGHVVELIMAALAVHRAPGAVRALGECLGNPDPFVRSSAVRAMEGHEGSHVVALLLRASRDPAPAIGRMGGRALVRRVERRPAILADIRHQTAEGVIELLDVQWAMELLADTYPEAIRLLAARRLGQIGGDDATTTLVSLIEATQGPVRDACWGALEACGEVSDHLLLPLLACSDPAARARALTVYGRFADANGEHMLAGFTKDADPTVRKAALKALMQVIEGGVLPHLRGAVTDEDPDVRLCVVDLLCQLTDTATDLVGVVQRESGPMKRKALTWLANHSIVTPELVMDYMEFLLQGAAVTDVSDREYIDGLGAAARALGSQRVPEGLLALTALARSIIKRLRRVAIEGLLGYPPEDRSDALFSLQDSYDLDVIKNVALGLHESRDPRSVVPLIRAAFECKGRGQQRAKNALGEYDATSDLEFLLSCLKNRWASVRRYGAERLRDIHDPASIPGLLEASRDEDVEVQLAVFEALGVFAAESKDVVERMLEAVRFADISVRQLACESLGLARCKEAVPELVKALHNFFLRPRASEALRRIGDRKGYLAMKRIERREALFPKKPKEVLERERKRKMAALDANT